MKNKTIISFFTGVLLCSIILFVDYDATNEEAPMEFYILTFIIIIAVHLFVSSLLLLKLDKLWIVFAYNLSFLISIFILHKFELAYFYMFYYVMFYFLKILLNWSIVKTSAYDILDN